MIMEKETYMVMDDGGTRIKFESEAGVCRFIVRTNAWSKEGIFANDVLVVQQSQNLANGDWAILEFDAKKIVRQVEITDDVLRFKSLDAKLQPIDWPMHKPVPLLGIVKTIIRQRL